MIRLFYAYLSYRMGESQRTKMVFALIRSSTDRHCAVFQLLQGRLEMEMEKNEAATVTAAAAAVAASEAARPYSSSPSPPTSSSPPSPSAERAAIPLTWQQHHRGLKFSAELDTLWQRRCSHRHQGMKETLFLSNFQKQPFSERRSLIGTFPPIWKNNL